MRMMYRDMVDRTSKHRSMLDVEKFMMECGFSDPIEAREAVSYYTGLDSGMPMNVIAGDKSVYVATKYEFPSALTGKYGLDQAGAMRMMKYLRRTVDLGENPHKVVRELSSLMTYVLDHPASSVSRVF